MSQTDATTQRGNGLRLLILAMLAWLVFLGHFNRVSIAVAGNERFIEEGTIDRESMGQVYTAFLVVYTACMLPAGWFIDRVGPTTALSCMGIGLGLCVTLTGVVGWQYETAGGLWLSLMVVRSMAGAASAPLHPAAARSVGIWFAPGSRIRANGVVTAGALLGIAASYPVFGSLMDRFDWPLAFVACGAATVVFAVVWRLVASDGEDARRSPDAAAWPTKAKPEIPSTHRSRPAASDARSLFLDRGLILLSLSYAAVGYFQYLFFYWIENYFSETLRLGNEESRRASSIVMIAMAVGMACGGWFADALCRRWGSRTGRRATAFVGMTASAAFALVGMSTHEPDRVVMWFSLALASLGACEGVFWTTVTDLGGHRGGLAAALLNTFGNGGGALAPWLTAVLIQRFDWQTAVGVACAVCGAGAVLWFAFDPGKVREAIAQREPGHVPRGDA